MIIVDVYPEKEPQLSSAQNGTAIALFRICKGSPALPPAWILAQAAWLWATEKVPGPEEIIIGVV